MGVAGVPFVRIGYRLHSQTASPARKSDGGLRVVGFVCLFVPSWPFPLLMLSPRPIPTYPPSLPLGCQCRAGGIATISGAMAVSNGHAGVPQFARLSAAIYHSRYDLLVQPFQPHPQDLPPTRASRRPQRESGTISRVEMEESKRSALASHPSAFVTTEME